MTLCACGCATPVNPAGGRRYVDARHRRAAFEKRHPRVDRLTPAELQERAARARGAEEAQVRLRVKRYDTMSGEELKAEAVRRWGRRRPRPQRRVWLPPDAWALVEQRAEETGERPSAYVARLVREHEEFLTNLARAVAGGAHARQRP